MNLQDIFNTVVMMDEKVSLSFGQRSEYESLRTSLIRKFAQYKKTCQEVGIETYDDVYMQCLCVKHETVGYVGTFKLAASGDRQNAKKEYTPINL